MKGLSIWVMVKLEERIRKYGHIMESTAQFVKSISKVRPKQSHKFYQLDIKDYFMSGEACELIDDAVNIICDDNVLKGLVRRALDLLLSCQFVEAPGLPGRLWRTIRGNGMGLPHSGA
jgi:hypothetical protein